MNRDRLVRALEAALAILREPDDDAESGRPIDPVLDVDATAKILSVKPKTIRRMASRGELPAVKLPGTRQWRFRRTDIESWLAKNGRAA